MDFLRVRLTQFSETERYRFEYRFDLHGFERSSAIGSLIGLTYALYVQGVAKVRGISLQGL